MQQLEITFESNSIINAERLGGQNKRLFEYLANGNSIHVFHPAKRELKIGFLNSRASDLINKHGVNISKRYIQVKDTDGNYCTVVEYSLSNEK